MRIAIVAPSPNPFLVGGAENLWWGMLAYLNRETPHVADLIKIPVKETSLPDLVAGYEAFSRLDLSGFDAVISSKYPAWMVSHPCHSIYVQHRCRGYYDWYPPHLEKAYAGNEPAILELLELARRHAGDRAALPEFFARFKALCAMTAAQPEIARHPGPVGRAVIHFLDGVGFDPRGIRRYAAIARAVKRRPGYFPEGVPVEVVYHPTNKSGFHSRAGEYFLTASRFYPSKRIEILIDAYRRTAIPLPFRIAGTGDEEAKLREHAAGDPRIEFTGFVRDEELIELYAGAVGVAFIPADEDFGYITLEAMLAGKPVITSNDSGGPLELVTHGETGLVAEPSAAALAECFERMYANPAEVRAMGERARERARSITWQGVFEVLLTGDGPATAEAPAPARPKVVVLNAYSVHPPNHGGRYRLHSLYAALASQVDVEMVTLGLHGEGDASIQAAPGLREVRVERSLDHHAADQAAHGAAKVPVYDITALENIALTPRYLEALRRALEGATLVVVSHPYMLGALRQVGYAGPFVHEAHNVELELKRRMLPESGARERLLALVEEAESTCCRNAGLVFATCETDAEAVVRDYGVPSGNVIVVPNGTAVRRIPFVDAAARKALRSRMGIMDRPVALFLASGHGPNLESAEHLFRVAERMPDVAFALVGNVADAFLHRKLPANVWLVGIVPEQERNIWLELAHVALNPVLYGGGTNLKLLDYLAAGTPVVSTQVGVRGTGAEHGKHVLVASMEALEPAIRTAVAGGARIERMVEAGRRLVEERFDWDVIAGHLLGELRSRGLLG